MGWDVVFKKQEEVREAESFVKGFYEEHEGELVNSKILDLGCGTGRHSVFFANKGRGIKVYSLDKSKLALNILSEKIKGGGVSLVESSFDEIPFPNNFFDVIVSTLALHHGKKKQIEAWMAEIRRVLKPNGFLVMSLLSRNDVRSNTGEEVEPSTRIGISDTFDSEVPHHFFTKEEVENLLKNFMILKIRENESIAAEGYKKFKHWEVIAKLLI